MHLLPGRGMPYGPYAPRFIVPFIVDVGDFAGSSPGLWDSTLTDLEHRRCLRNVDNTSKMQLPSRDEHEGRGHRLKCPRAPDDPPSGRWFQSQLLRPDCQAPPGPGASPCSGHSAVPAVPSVSRVTLGNKLLTLSMP